MEHIEHDAGADCPGGMPLVGRDIEHLPRLKQVLNARDGKLEGAAEEQGPLLVRVGVIRDHGTRRDVHPALSYMV